MEPHINSHMEFTWKIDKRSRINGLHDFDSHMENKYTMCIIVKIAILSIMVVRFDFFFDKMGKIAVFADKKRPCPEVLRS